LAFVDYKSFVGNLASTGWLLDVLKEKIIGRKEGQYLQLNGYMTMTLGGFGIGTKE
jgi:hypothetical protein